MLADIFSEKERQSWKKVKESILEGNFRHTETTRQKTLLIETIELSLNQNTELNAEQSSQVAQQIGRDLMIQTNGNFEKEKIENALYAMQYAFYAFVQQAQTEGQKGGQE